MERPNARAERLRAAARRLVEGLASCALAAALAPAPAAAQGGWWPWATQEPSRPPPLPREPVFRTPQGPPGAPPPGAPQARPIERGNICLELEQRLVLETQRGSQSRELLPKIEADLRLYDRTYRQGEAQLERQQCYEQWFLSRSLRKTKPCLDLAAQVESARRRVAELDTQRQQILGSRDRGFQDDIIRELARNNCGATYQAEARKRGGNPFASLWQDEDTRPGRGNEFGALPFATYRTICVRLCDGYYFPVSFSTLENHFARDADACQSKCAAPAELYYYQNPGEAVEQARSARSRQPYTSLRTAFLYRKQYVAGCSCKVSEYTPSPTDRGDRRTEAPAQPLPPVPPRQAQR